MRENRIKNIWLDLSIIFIVILFCNAFFLINGGIYWDDWIGLDSIVSNGFAGRLKLFPIFKLLHFNVYYNVFVARVLLVLAELLGAVSLYMIIRNMQAVKGFALYISLLTFTVPIYLARYTFCCFDYYISLYFFYFASLLYLLFLKSVKEGKIKLVVLSSLFSVLLYLKSFQTASTFVFYIVPYAFGYFFFYDSYSIKFWKKENLRKIAHYFILTSIFFALPFLMWVIKLCFFSPTGVYAESEYYKLRPYEILNCFNSFFSVFYDLFRKIIKQRLLHICVLFIIANNFVNYKLHEKFEYSKFNIREVVLLVLTIIFTGFFAVFAYSAIGRFGVLFYFESRHLLFCGLSIALSSFLFVTILTLTIKGVNLRMLKIGLFIVVLFFSFTRFVNGYYMYKEYLKQEFLIRNFSSSKQIEEKEVFLCDWTTFFSQYGKPDFCELSGYAYKAYNTRNHLIVIKEQKDRLKSFYEMKDAGDYKIKDIKDYSIDGEISFTFKPSKKEVLKAIMLQFTDKTSFFNYVQYLGDFTVTLF